MKTMFQASKFVPQAVAVAVASMVLAGIPVQCASAETATDQIAIGRDQLRVARTATVAKHMQLTEEEGKAFWPLYRKYRGAMDKISDSLLKLVVEYSELYPNVPAERAEKMLKDYIVLEKKFVETRAEYLEKFAKALAPSKVLLLAQIENRLDVTVRLQLADAIPLMPAPAAAAKTADAKKPK